VLLFKQFFKQYILLPKTRLNSLVYDAALKTSKEALSIIQSVSHAIYWSTAHMESDSSFASIYLND